MREYNSKQDFVLGKCIIKERRQNKGILGYKVDKTINLLVRIKRSTKYHTTARKKCTKDTKTNGNINCQQMAI